MIINDSGEIAGNAIVEAARLARLNVPYQWGGNGPNAFDCSGLVQWCMSVGGYPNLPKDRRVWNTGNLRILGSAINPGQQLPGDLIFPDATHVGICVDKTHFIDAPETGKTVGVHDFTKYNGGKYSVVRIVTPYTGGTGLTGAIIGTLAPFTQTGVDAVAPVVNAGTEIFNALAGPIAWLSDSANWIRIGMIVAGGALGLYGIIKLEE